MNRGVMILFFLATLLTVCFPFFAITTESSLTIGTFFGRFHPLILHFPIVLFLIVLAKEIMESLNLKPDWILPKKWFSLLLQLSVGMILLTTILGYLLYRSGEYQGDLVRDHLIGGVLLSTTSFLALALYTQEGLVKGNVNRPLYKGLIFLSGIILLYTSHIGASITHGKNFLTEHLPAIGINKPAAIEKKNPEELLVYKEMIVPFLDKRCYSCHNEYKTKGGLLMTNWNDLNKGGKSEKAILVAGAPDKSELFHRITLPIDHEDRMPPSEKPGLTQDEIDILKWWIQEGGVQDMVLGAGPSDPALQTTINRYLPTLYKSARLREQKQKDINKLASELKEVGEKLGLEIELDKASDAINFAISMKMPPVIVQDETLNSLLDYKEMFSKISLPASDISDDALYAFSKMKNLKAIYISKTKITGAGMIHLKTLENLEFLNLSHTNLSDEDVLNLLQIPSLKEVYLFNTPISTKVLEAIQKNKPDLKLLVEEGPLF